MHHPLVQFAHAAGIHARAAQKHRSFAADHAPKHSLKIVIALRRFLPGLGHEYRVSHQKDYYLRGFSSLEQSVRQPKRIVDSLRAIGRIVDDE